MAFDTFSWTGQGRPMAPKPPPVTRHGDDKGPTSAWTTPPAGTGQGYSDPQAVDIGMQARGLQRDLSWAYGHRGTDTTGRALAPANGAWNTWEHSRNVAQESSAAAHGDTRTMRLTDHQYNPQPQEGAGYAQGVDRADGKPGPTMSAQAALHDRPGGQFSTGAQGQFGPTGFRLGISRRWASRNYSSPALGAMYSKNSLRGILPQIVATPHNQPPLAGPMESGIGSNARFLARTFTLPSLFTVPRSQSDVLMAAQPAPPQYTAVLGTGMM
jgi:hypothetical protein